MSQGLVAAGALPAGYGALAPSTPGHGQVAPATGYFQRTAPVALILGTFVVLTLPLTWLVLTDPDSALLYNLEVVYLVTLGLTHFCITPTIYLQSRNLQFFNSSTRNRLIYFAIPVAIFAGFGLYRALEIAILLPALDVAVGLAVRALDFQHFTRQNYGVLQLFKARAGVRFPAWQRRAEYWFAWTTVGVLLATYLRGGRADAEAPPILVATHYALAAVMAGLGLTIVAGLIVTARHADRPGRLAAPATYFILQTLSALLAAYSTALYGIALAMHYVEYHVLMLPRCFNTPLDPRRLVDRAFGALRSSRVVFYLLLVLVAFGVALLTGVTTSMDNAMRAMAAAMWRSLAASDDPGNRYAALLALFNGLFVFHYFVEMFIWRFSEPHYRQTLSPLYFAAQPRPATS